MKRIPDETYGIIENMLATAILFSPNFLFLFQFFRERIFLVLIYNMVIMFIMVSTISHLKYGVKLIPDSKLNLGIRKI